MKYFKLFIFLISTLNAWAISAGEVTLNNGDKIHGELQAIHKDSIIWLSEVFGVITLPKEKITRLHSSTLLPFSSDTLPVTAFSPTTDNSEYNPQKEAIDHCSLNIEDSVSAICNSGKLSNLSLDKIATIKLTPEPPPFKGEVKFGFNQKSGNTDSEELDVAISTQWNQQDFRHEVDFTAESDSADGDVVDEQYDARYQINYDFDEHWFSYGRLKYEKNRFSAIDEQIQAGLGLGHKLKLDNQLLINAQLGATFLSTRRPGTDLESGSNNKDAAGRWALKLDWPIPTSELTVFHRHELLWLIDEIDNTQLETSTGIKIPLLGGIFSEIRYDMDHVSEPASDQEQADHEWVISVGYNW
jgi:putative salt-induced outer membrane protein YdiY